jgi:hypothetical protein
MRQPFSEKDDAWFNKVKEAFRDESFENRYSPSETPLKR